MDNEISKREFQGQETRKRIIDAALRLFSERGFAATSTKLIAREADVSEGLIFHHFARKVDLLPAIFQTHRTFAGEIRSIVRTHTDHPARECMKAIAEGYVDLLQKESRLINVLLAESRFDDGLYDMLRTVFTDTIDEVAVYLEGRKQQGELRQDLETKSAVMSFLGSLLLFFILNKHLPAANG